MKNALPLTLAAVAISAAAFATVGSKSAVSETLPGGLKAGESVSAFHPKHVSGPLANTDKCFPCTFQNRPQVQVWVNGDTAENVGKIAQALDAQMTAQKGAEFKALIVVLHDDATAPAATELAKSISSKYGAKQVGVALLDKKAQPVTDYKINLDAKNTVYAYKNWKVTDVWSNVDAKKDGKALEAGVAKIVK